MCLCLSFFLCVLLYIRLGHFPWRYPCCIYCSHLNVCTRRESVSPTLLHLSSCLLLWHMALLEESNRGVIGTCCVVLKWMAKSGVECCNKIAEGTEGRHSFHRCRVESELVSISCLELWAMFAPYVSRRRFFLALCAYRKYIVCPVVMNNTEMITRMPKCCGCGAEITMMKWSRSIR